MRAVAPFPLLEGFPFLKIANVSSHSGGFNSSSAVWWQLALMFRCSSERQVYKIDRKCC